ncbi:MAG: hypothetical protein C0468_05305 [Planctomyces sp.]|nr:hypothetical protein [Planctomyces sp.]
MRLLYLAPTFLSYRLHKRVRGVQVFDLQFIPDLARLGVHVTVPAEITWRSRLRQLLPDHPNIRVRYTPPLFKPLWNGLYAAAALGGRFDAAFVGNPARGLIPPIDLMLRRGLFQRIVLQANRGPHPRAAAALRRWPLRAVAVSEQVRADFPPDLRPHVDVYYGVLDADRFAPPTPAQSPPPEPVRFALLGKLDNPWKGADTAVDAFLSLPPSVRGRCQLHLISFDQPPQRLAAHADIVTHPWLPAERVPDLLRSMHVLLVPSSAGETFSQVMVQGMLTGLPVLASALPVLAEKLDTGGGVVCADGPALAAAMAAMAQDPELRARHGVIARRVALERYVWDTRAFVDRFLFPATP